MARYDRLVSAKTKRGSSAVLVVVLVVAFFIAFLVASQGHVHLLTIALVLIVVYGLPVAAIVDLAMTAEDAFPKRAMGKEGWIILISILTLLTVIGGIVTALWWLLVSRRRIPD
jgi:hypothetical protein